jgi:hypothetical protein
MIHFSSPAGSGAAACMIAVDLVHDSCPNVAITHKWKQRRSSEVIRNQNLRLARSAPDSSSAFRCGARQ